MTDVQPGAGGGPALAWLTDDPDGLAARLVGLGFSVTDRTLELASMTIRLERGRPADRLRSTIVDPRITGEPLTGHPNGVTDLAALGLATVDADRAAETYGAALEPLPDDFLLGARVVSVAAGPIPLLLLEPLTEGRLAATLARHGEGPAVLYLSTSHDGLGRLESRLRAAGERTRTAPIGPFGRSVALTGQPAWGPHLVFVEAGPERVPSRP